MGLSEAVEVIDTAICAAQDHDRMVALLPYVIRPDCQNAAWSHNEWFTLTEVVSGFLDVTRNEIEWVMGHVGDERWCPNRSVSLYSEKDPKLGTILIIGPTGQLELL